MRLDEEVARKEKVCPMTMTFIEAGRFRSHNCIGSKCMAWRGTPEVTVSFPIIAVKDEKAKKSKVTKKANGYCGMAGPPEVNA